ncbi:phage portal protein [Caldibacillus lycopersici]|uniref:Phage portal protein n=1 Tax=Perspicuibacillus lycopersici TaxID=1325689 RepID=A0AAE3IT21_9BACI|nr:phage portal protein [Perspicuibacillus lycopersici]MCU9614093.1 phage portal protein [Perspicuibacillus lycopersici]
MTIQYVKQKFPPPPFDDQLENILYFRELYEGNHENIFDITSLNQDAIATKKELRKVPYYSRPRVEQKVKALESNIRYVVVNFSAVIAELPADLINRSLGNISADTENDNQLLEFVEAVSKTSKINQNIWSAVVQHQVDGGVAYRIRRDAKGTWFEWKPADLYLEHEDGLGADITWKEKREKKEYLRVERQRIEGDKLFIKQLVFLIDGDTVKEELEIREYAAQYKLIIPDDQVLDGVNELMCGFVPNDETLLVPRGRSALRNVDKIQEEINWTITRDSIVFEKHGKPKLAIPSGLWDSVANKNHSHYGSRFVRNADLEVVSYDEKNGAVPMYIVWDAKTEQSFEHVKRLIEYMMSVSKTSPQAAGVKDGKGESAIALLYLWIQSVIKAEAIKDKFDTAIKEAIRKCTILENALGGTNFEIKDPVVEWADMLPKADSEKDDEESTKYERGVQSLETTVRNLHPDWSEDAIQAEVDKILEEKAVNSMNPTYTQPPKANVNDEDDDDE